MIKYKTGLDKRPANRYWPTVCRALLFCILCGVALALSSTLVLTTKGSWSQTLVVLIPVATALILTKVFVLWEGIKMKDVGVIPNWKSFSKFSAGFGIGLLLAALQPALVLSTGHIKLLLSPGFSFNTLIESFILYLAIGLREEVAFRGFPLFSLKRVAGPLFALSVVGVIFIVEHKVGGMNWWSAIFGPGVGSVLFGLSAIKTNGIALSFGLHSAWNLGQWILGFKSEQGLLHTIIEKGCEGRIELIGWASYLLVMGIAISGFYFSLRNYKSK